MDKAKSPSKEGRCTNQQRREEEEEQGRRGGGVVKPLPPTMACVARPSSVIQEMFGISRRNMYDLYQPRIGSEWEAWLR